jgi:hypothetical protein
VANVEHLADILPVKHDSHTETGHFSLRPLLFSPHELLLGNGCYAGTAQCSFAWMLRERVRVNVPSPSSGPSVSDFIGF